MTLRFRTAATRSFAALALGALLFATSLRSGATDLSAIPKPAQPRISAELGRNSPDYFPSRLEHTIALANPNNRMLARFTADGADFHRDASSWHISLIGLGYGSAVSPDRPVVPAAHLNRVEYRRAELSEWYVNGPLGMEQGFTIPRRPIRHNSGLLTITLQVSGNLTMRADANGKGLQLSAGPLAKWNYSNLVSWDASGKEIVSRLRIDNDRLLIEVDDSNAIYPLTVDPIIQLADLTVINGTSNDWTGYSVAVSGNTIAVGAPNANDGTNIHAGAVYVFVKPSTGWANMVETAKLTGSNGAIAFVGNTVAIDGGTIVTGAIDPNTFARILLVFVKPSGGWKTLIQTAQLSTTDAKVDGAAFSQVSISGDTIVAGAGLAVPLVGQQGEAYVYVKPSDGWNDMTQTAILTASDVGNSDNFGTSVSISGDVLVVGSPGKGTFNLSQVGAAYIYVKPINGWADMTQTAELTTSDGMSSDRVGTSVAVSGDTVVAGAPVATIGSSSMQGAVYVFSKPAAGWQNQTETAKLTIPAGRGDIQFGTAVAISGSSIVIGAPKVTAGSNAFQGAAFLYTKPVAGWKTTSQATSFLTAGSTDSSFGESLALGGGVVVAGAPVGFNGKAKASGSAYVFSLQNAGSQKR